MSKTKKQALAARMIANRAAGRSMASILNAAANYPGGDAKHNHNRDFGFPDDLVFQDFYEMFDRNGIASGLVEQTVLETWQDFPEFIETPDPKQTPLELEIATHLDRIRFWQNIAEVDKRGMVGQYSAIIMRFADSKPFDAPVDRVTGGGIGGLVEIIPVWEAQLIVSSVDTDVQSETYGQPTMFQFQESNVTEDESTGNPPKNRSFQVHPDRVVLWSRTGGIAGRSKMKPCFNDLLTLQKIVGAGGQGFWKNAKSTPVLEAEKDLDLTVMAQGMGVPVDELADAMEKQVDDFNSGFDSMLMLKGMKANTLGVSLPIPEHFVSAALQGICASWPIPQKKLLGSQTGERASTEDAAAWAKTCNARRVNLAKPFLMAVIDRLVKYKILPEKSWAIKWSDLTESSTEDKLARAKDMAEVNAKTPDRPSFTTGEIREMAGKDPTTVIDDDGEDDETDDDEQNEE